MTSPIDRLFSPDDRTRIEKAVRDAETTTAGEIVPVVVEQSDTYEEAVWRGSLVSAIFALLVVLLIREFMSLWLNLNMIQLAILILACGGIAGMFVAFVPAVKRFFAGSDLLEHRVSQRATEAFVNKEVFNTRDRSGILIFISLLEHKVIVMGDSGINARVGKDEWEGIVNHVVSGIHSGKAADGLVKAIQESASLLQQRGIEKRTGDVNELPDTLHTRGS